MMMTWIRVATVGETVRTLIYLESEPVEFTDGLNLG